MQTHLLGLLGKVDAQLFDAGGNADEVEHLKLLGQRVQRVSGDHVAELVAVLHLVQVFHGLVGNAGGDLGKLVEEVQQHAARGIHQKRGALLTGKVLHFSMLAGGQVLDGKKFGAAQALDRDADGAVGGAQYALDARDGAHLVEGLKLGHAHRVHLVGDQKDLAPLVHGALKGGKIADVAHLKGGVHVRKDDELVQRNEGKQLHKAVHAIGIVTHKPKKTSVYL